MAITNINPASNSVVGPADSFSFDIDQTYTSLVVKISAAGGDEYAYDYALGGAQAGYTVTITDLGSQDQVSISRDAGWDKEPVPVTVVENETGSIVTTQFQFYLTSTRIYPEGMQPYSDAYEGSLIVTEEDVQVRGDVGWIDYEGDDFDLTDMGNGKVKVAANASLKGGGPGGGSGLGGIGKWTIQNVAGSGTPTGGGIIINSSDNTAITSILMDTTTADGQVYEQWLQTFDALGEGLTITVYSSDGTKWFSSPVSSMALGTANYRNFTINHADKTNSGAHTWTVSDEVYIEVLPSQPDTGALSEPSTFGIGGFRYDDDLLGSSPTWYSPSFRLNNVRPSSATKLWIFYSNRQGYDIQSILSAHTGSKITFHAKTLTNGSFQCTLGTGIDYGNYWEFPISDITDAGVDLVDGHYYGATLIPPSGGDAGAVNGFTDMDAVTVSINEGTRTLTMTGTFDIYSNGVKYSKTNPSASWSDSYSPFFFAFDAAGTLKVTSAITPAMVKTECLVGYLWWHQVNNETCGGFYNLMKHHTTDPDMWFHELFNRGCEYNYGMNPNTVGTVVDGDGSANSHCELGLYSGHMLLGGTKHEVQTRTATTAVTKAKRMGSDSGGFYEQLDIATTGIVATTGTGRAGYNYYNSLTECADDSYVWAHMFARTGDNYDEAKDIIWIGLDNYTTKPLAEQGCAAEVAEIMQFPQNAQGGMQAAMCPIASVLVHTKSSYTNSFKSRRVTLSTGDAYIAWWDTRIYPKLYSSLGPAIGGPIGRFPGINPPAEVAGAPGASNDQDEGYTPGSLWINTSLNDVYICCDASSGAAVWKIIAT